MGGQGRGENPARASVGARTGQAGWLAAALAGAACGRALDEPPADVDPNPRPPPAAPACRADDGVDAVASGRAFTADGVPVPGVAIGRREGGEVTEVLGRTDAEGAFKIVVPSGTWLAVADRAAEPAAWCQSTPMKVAFAGAAPGSRFRLNVRENNALVAPTCWERLDAADAAPARARLVVHDDQGPRDAGEVDPAAPLPVPCDARGWSLVGEAVYAAFGDGWTAPVSDGRAPARVTWRPARPLTVRARTPDGQAAEGARVVTPLGVRRLDARGELRLALPPDVAAPRLDDPRYLPAPFADGVAVATPARLVQVRCAGNVDARCSVLPTVRPLDGGPSWRCEHGALATCRVPAGADVILSIPGVDTRLPADAAVAWIDLRHHGAELRAGVAGGCTWTARRDDHSPAAWWAWLRDAPRLTVVGGGCLADGALRTGVLTPGRWSLEVVPFDGPPITRVVDVATEVVTLGELR